MDNAQKVILAVTKKSPDPDFLRDVFDFAQKVYGESQSPWGEPYINHIAGTAAVLERFGLDPETIAAGILHDIPADKIPEVEQRFGPVVAGMVRHFSELKRTYFSFRESNYERFFAKEKIENIRRMFIAIAKDVRVILIELAARIDRLRKIADIPEDKRKLYATETLQVFVPIAHRLGLAVVRRELEDLAFPYLFPAEYQSLKEKVKEPYEDRERQLRRLMPKLEKIFKKEHVKVLDINSRTKSYWSTHLKLQRYGDLSRINDLVAIRIITDSVESCYKMLGIVHKYFTPISEEIDDYIAKPKANGYRSLHTTVFYGDGKVTEIQIRTQEMHEEAEYGICAHWVYREHGSIKNTEGHLFTLDFYENQVFAFTPKGDVFALPKGACTIDFAYAIHSEIGNHCETAKINGKIVPLHEPLQNGDIVEIIVNKRRQPSPDWLRCVKTSFAKSHIKKALEEKKSRFVIPIPGFIKQGFLGLTTAIRKKEEVKQKIKKEGPRQIFLAGQKGILMKLAKCCNPQPGDKIKAYLAPQRAATLHRTTCATFLKIKEKFPDRIIEASWD